MMAEERFLLRHQNREKDSKVAKNKEFHRSSFVTLVAVDDKCRLCRLKSSSMMMLCTTAAAATEMREQLNRSAATHNDHTSWSSIDIETNNDDDGSYADEKHIQKKRESHCHRAIQ